VLAVLIRRPPGSETAERFPIQSAEVSIGRVAGNDVILDDPSVSARHARIRLDGGVWTLADLGTVGGSLVDGEPVQQALPLGPGSIVRVGKVELAFAPQDRWQDSVGAPVVPLDPAPPVSRPRPVMAEPRPQTNGFVLSVPERRGIPVPVLIGLAVIAIGVIGYLLARGG
jgi:predicted component of type VI protein secretion system